MIELHREYQRNINARLRRKNIDQLINHTTEEMGELLVALNKFRRKHLEPTGIGFKDLTQMKLQQLVQTNDPEMRNLVDELGDAITLLLVVKHHFDNHKSVTSSISQKVESKNKKWGLE